MNNIPPSTMLLIFCLVLGVVVVGIITLFNITVSPNVDNPLPANGSNGVIPNSFIAGVLICIGFLVILEILSRKIDKRKK